MLTSKASRLFLLLFFALAVAFSEGHRSVATAQKILRVDTDADSLGDGSSWGRPMKFLQQALREARANPDVNYEIWVAEGVYYPDRNGQNPSGTGDEQAAFVISQDNVKLYGGFQGGESERNERDPEANRVVLSGDIGQDDNTDANGVTRSPEDIRPTNSTRVVRFQGANPPKITRETVLDGVTVTGGSATKDRQFPKGHGGGILCEGHHGGECSPVIRRVTIQGNRAGTGGGMIYAVANNGSGSALLSDVTFRNNAAVFIGDSTYGGGGALQLNLFNGGEAEIIVRDSRFLNNSAAKLGGAIRGNFGRENSGSGNPRFEEILFRGNSALRGGAVFHSGTANGTVVPQFQNVRFIQNQTAAGTDANGGAVFNNGYQGVSSPRFDGAVFRENEADRGGAMFNNGDQGESNPQVTGSEFKNNVAREGNPGGAVFNAGYNSGLSAPSFVNTLFEGNEASAGGAIFNNGNEGESSPFVVNSRFVNNQTRENGGGAVYSAGWGGGESTPVFVNTIFLRNESGSVGGAVMNHGTDSGDGEKPKYINTTFVENSASESGGGMSNFDTDSEDATPVVRNSIFWSNAAGEADEIVNEGAGASASIGHSIVEGGINGENVRGTQNTDEGSNQAQNPQFLNLSKSGDSSEDNLHLSATSPAVDAGSENALPVDRVDLDNDGNTTEPIPIALGQEPRIQREGVDLGAYERGTLQEVQVGLSASVTSEDVTLSWEDVQGVEEYTIYRSNSDFDQLSEARRKITISPAEGTSYTDTTTTPGTRYYYRLGGIDQEGSEALRSESVSATPQSLKLIGLEVNQAVQDWENSVPLVENKRTAVRVFMRSGDTLQTPVDVRLKGERSGTELPNSPLKPKNRNKFEPTRIESQFDRSDVDNSLNFDLPSSWQRGTVSLTLVGDGLDCSGASSTDQECELQVSFESVPSLEITFFRIVWNDNQGEAHEPLVNFEEEIEQIAKRLPIPEENIEYRTGVLDSPNEDPSSPPDMKNVLSRLSEIREADIDDGWSDPDRIYFGFISDVQQDSVTGLANDVPGDVALKKTGEDTGLAGEDVSGGPNSTTPHEIGHIFGAHHAVNEKENGTDGGSSWFLDESGAQAKGYCGEKAPADEAIEFPYDAQTEYTDSTVSALGPAIEEEAVWGVDIDTSGTSLFIPRSTRGSRSPYAPLMSYCGDKKWISDTTYVRLLRSVKSRFKKEEKVLADRSDSQTSRVKSTKEQKTTYLLVRGQISLNSPSVSFQNFGVSELTSTEANRRSMKSGNFTLQALNEENNVLAEQSFTPTTPVSNTSIDAASFSLPVKEDPKIREIRVLHNAETASSGEVIGRIKASPTTPSVKVLSPTSDDDLTGKKAEIRWTGSDPDEDTLSYTVQYSPNRGATWRTLNTGLRDTTLHVNPENLTGSSEGLIRVQASDGFNTSSNTTAGTFSTPNTTPRSQVLSPTSSSVVDSSETVYLEGRGRDREDGDLSGPNLVWRSDKAGRLGTGTTLEVPASSLPIGENLITLTATDSEGAASKDSVRVRVALSGDPSLRASQTKQLQSSGLTEFSEAGVRIDITEPEKSGPLTVERYARQPTGTSTIKESQVLDQRFIIKGGDGLQLGAGTEVYFSLDALQGVEDTSTTTIYRRPTPGNGAFIPLQSRSKERKTTELENGEELVVAVSGGGEFAIGSNPPPAVLSDFGATIADEQSVQLSWETETERSGTEFVVQRRKSTGSDAWSRVKTVEGRGGSSDGESYQFTSDDLSYEVDSLTYRLKLIGPEGITTYSDEASVKRKLNRVELLNTYPNPTRRQVTIRYGLPERQEVTVRIYDVLGRRVRTIVNAEQEGRQSASVDVSRLASGTYFLRLKAGDQTRSQKFVVVH